MKVVVVGGTLAAISKTLEGFEGAYIGTTRVSAEAVADYWEAFDRVEAEADLASSSVEMVLGKLATDPRTAPRVEWIEGLVWYEVDTPEDLALARAGLAA
jgi:choline kinase